MESSGGVPMISIQGVNKHFGALHVLKDINLDVDRGQVVHGQAGPQPDYPQRVAPHPVLAGIVGGDLDDHDRLHPGQHDAVPPAAEPRGGHRVRPGMMLGGRYENRGQTARLGLGERGAATDHPQRAVLLVQAGHDRGERGERADHRTDHHHFSRLPALHLDPAAGTRLVPGGGALDHQAFYPRRPVLGHPPVGELFGGGDRGQLQGWPPVAGQFLQGGAAGPQRNIAQVPSGDRE